MREEKDSMMEEINTKEEDLILLKARLDAQQIDIQQ